MSLFILDLERLRFVTALDPAATAYSTEARWRVCPECLWLTVGYDADLVCRRPEGENVAYGGSHGWQRGCDVTLAVVPEETGDALWSALRLGGINAVVEMLHSLQPETIGLLSGVAKYRERRGRR